MDLYKSDFPLNADSADTVLWAVFFSLIWCIVIVVVSIRHRKRMQRPVLIFMTTVNCLFGFLPMLSFTTIPFVDRSTLLLGVALLSALFNLFAYVLGTMKRVDLITRLFRLFLGAVIFATAIPAMLFFANSPSNKALSPWRSREENAPCVSSNFYDEHDLWHLMSAVALGLTILLLMHAGEESGPNTYSQVLPKDLLHDSEAPTESTPLI